MWERSFLAGAVNVMGAGYSGVLKYADEGIAGFNTSRKFKDIMRAAFKDSFTLKTIDAASSFGAVHYSVQGSMISLMVR